MNIIDKFDVTVFGYLDYQDEIKSLYPGQNLELNYKFGERRIYIEGSEGVVGALYEDTTEALLPYIENSDKYYIDTYVKKFYEKEPLKKALVLIIKVYEVSQDFGKPNRPFLGDLITPDSKKYLWGNLRDSEFPVRCTIDVSRTSPRLLQNLYEGDGVIFVREERSSEINIFDELGGWIGQLPKKFVEQLTAIMVNPDQFISADIIKIGQNESGKWSCRIEIDVLEKKGLLENKSIAPEESQNKPKKKNKAAGCLKTFFIVLGVIFFIFIVWAMMID